MEEEAGHRNSNIVITMLYINALSPGGSLLLCKHQVQTNDTRPVTEDICSVHPHDQSEAKIKPRRGQKVGGGGRG
jgi:hypothetical protein